MVDRCKGISFFLFLCRYDIDDYSFLLEMLFRILLVLLCSVLYDLIVFRGPPKMSCLCFRCQVCCLLPYGQLILSHAFNFHFYSNFSNIYIFGPKFSPKLWFYLPNKVYWISALGCPASLKLTYLKLTYLFQGFGCVHPISKIAPLFSKSVRQEKNTRNFCHL